ncbi:hypothetical protein J5TS2_03100 [Brevibacillus halotolerans]|uniref:hypothetical protein n=1 Tax=Brevibacillus halotolerans TaxID=1507437 RepID=UPI001B0986E5|nr:hypothetical protein [Brevibacillus halotolerans]GIN99641.1 hypothetical protein J5TS2_03100 [Brevibacillus halotolerans]
MRKVVYILISSLTIISTLVDPVDILSSHTLAATINAPQSPVLTSFQQYISAKASGTALKEFVDQHIAIASNKEAIELVLGLENYYVTHLKLWKPTYEQPSIQVKLQKLAKQHNSFDKLVQHDPLMQKLQQEIAQEGYKLTWKSKNILPAVPYEELAAYYSYLSNEIRSYLALKAIESQQPFTDGQRLRLSYHELSLRVSRSAFLRMLLFPWVKI